MATDRPIPSVHLSGAGAVPDVHIEAAHRARILDHLPLSDPSEADAAIAEIEEILAQLEVERGAAKGARGVYERLESLSKAAATLHMELGSLAPTDRSLLWDEDFELAKGAGLAQIARSAFRLSNAARRAAAPIRPTAGRPVAWPERIAASQLIDLWERRTGKAAIYSNREEDGGPFVRFVEAVSHDLSERQIRAVLEYRARNSGESV